MHEQTPSLYATQQNEFEFHFEHVRRWFVACVWLVGGVKLQFSRLFNVKTIDGGKHHSVPKYVRVYD